MPVSPTPPPCLARRLRASLVADLVPLADLAVLLPAAAGLAWLAPTPTGPAPSALAVEAVLIVLATLMLYDPRLASAHAARFALYAGAVLLLALLAVPPLEAATAGPPPAAPGASPWVWAAAWLGLTGLLTTATRTAAVATVQRLQRQGRLTERVAVVGDGPVAQRLVAVLAAAPAQRVELVGVFGDTRQPGGAEAGRALGSLDDLAVQARAGRLDWIVLAPEPSEDLREHARQNQLQRRLLALGVPLGLCPPQIGLSALDRPAAAVGDHLALGLLAERPIRQWGALLKATEDRLLAGLLLLLLAPLLALIALAIRLDSPGPVLFRQRRHALDNREFDIWKFRTMRTAAAAPADAAAPALVQTLRGDPRITRLGRLLRASSLDELPQLVNVLTGSMSLVGPRPHATDMRTDALLGHEITPLYRQRHRVKPGITGWAQVNGARGATDTPTQLRRRVALDLHYIAHWSLWLDLRILARTVGTVLGRANAF